MTTDTIPESAVADQLGIPASSISDLRKKNAAALPEGTAWARAGARRVVWTTEGIAALEGILELEKKSAPAARPVLPDCVVMVVNRVVPNPNFLIVQKKNAAGEADGPLLRLRVKSNHNFMPGMTVEHCRPVPASADLFNHEGRCPRYRGRW